jgi:hypothetical protein
MTCEACKLPRYVTLTYIRADGTRVVRPLCRDHAAIVWEALPQPLRESASLS